MNSKTTTLISLGLGIVLIIAIAFVFNNSQKPPTHVPPQTYKHQLYLSNIANTLDCSQVLPVTREQDDLITLEDIIHTLSKGPTQEEQAAGFSSFFSESTQGIMEVMLQNEDFIVINFIDPFSYPSFSNNSASCASAALTAQIEATVHAVYPDATVAVAIDKSIESWYEFIQIGCSLENEFCFIDRLH